MYLLDTDVFSMVLRGNDPAKEFILTHDPFLIYISAITAAESLKGWMSLIHQLSGGKGESQLPVAYASLSKAIEQINEYQVLPYDERAVSLYKQKKKPSGVGTNDMRIAAVAEANGLIVVTLNRSHFGKIGVRCYDWPVNDSE